MNFLLVSLLVIVNWASARIHKLETLNDTRKYIPLSTFGFYEGGILDVSLKQFRSVPFRDSDVFGFSLDKTLRYVMNPYLDNRQDNCILENPKASRDSSSSFGNGIYFVMDIKNEKLNVIGSKSGMVKIFKDREELRGKTSINAHPLSNSKLNGYVSHRRRRSSPNELITSIPMKVDKEQISVQMQLPPVRTFATCQGDRFIPELLQTRTISCNKIHTNVINLKFLVYIPSEASQGLYNLYFHNCPNYKMDGAVKVDIVVEIEEVNKNNYLSAGEMPLSALYFMMSLIFCLSGSFWIYILAKSKHPVYKIHYLMAILVYLKCLSLLFHGINFHFIQTNGEHVETWAILFYITYLLKGSVLFTVILLIGTGWTFIRRGDVLSDKHKKIFMIVLPLQVLANIAKIIIDESEEGDVEQQTWWDIFILVDILCCGAIMFPVVWTIRHLQEASHTDGKAAMNLRKLKLFRHFYIMIVCYFYFTRIIVYILKITVPFQYEWLDEMFREAATFVCFILTGYKFRPASANPYYQVPSEEDEVETCVVFSNENLAEGLKKVNRSETSDRTNSEETKRCLDYEP